MVNVEYIIRVTKGRRDITMVTNKALTGEMCRLEKMINSDKNLLKVYNNYNEYAIRDELDDRYRCGFKIIATFLKLKEMCNELDYNPPVKKSCKLTRTVIH